jgi:glycine cleavage system pyridoxal-binding protein P
MPDITMCKRDDCKSNKKCFRYMAEPSKYYQSYFAVNPEIKKGKCEYFYPYNVMVCKSKDIW